LERPVRHIPWGWIAGGVVAAVLLGAGLWFSFNPRFYIQHAQVVGTDRIPQEAVYEASGLHYVHTLWAHSRDAEDQILELLPSIEWVDVVCRLPAECTISVVERAPIVTWRSGEDLFLVDEIGVFTPSSEPLSAGWVVNGPVPVDDDGLVEHDVLVGLRELEQLGMAPQEVTYRPGKGLVITDGEGWRVIIGQGAGMERRLRVYARVRAYLMEQRVRPIYVDVRFPDAPYYSETNEW
jgi:cell division septal protein FtsQ